MVILIQHEIVYTKINNTIKILNPTNKGLYKCLQYKGRIYYLRILKFMGRQVLFLLKFSLDCL